MELITKLGIDWKLLVAQIVNFTILLVVLYKFVYGPVLAMLEKRTKTIEKGLHDAKVSEEKLIAIEKLSQERMSATEKEVGALLDRARHDAEGMKKDILAAAQTQADDLLRRTRLQIEEDKQKMLQEVKSEVTTHIVKLTGKLLEREFSDADQKRLAEALSKEMKSAEPQPPPQRGPAQAGRGPA